MVREAMRELLDGCANPDAAGRVRLLASELVTAAVRERRADPDGGLSFRAVMSGDLVRVEVSQAVPGFEPDADAGERPDWGRLLLERLADQWGVAEHHDDAERGVWFEVYLRSLAEVSVPVTSPRFRPSGRGAPPRRAPSASPTRSSPPGTPSR
jgi:hypothetical protein